MRNSTRMRITLSVSPRLLLPAYFVFPVYALRVIFTAGKRRWFALREKRRRLALSRKVSSMIVLWHSIAFENIMMVDEVPFSRYYAIKLFCVKWSLFPRRVTYQHHIIMIEEFLMDNTASTSSYTQITMYCTRYTILEYTRHTCKQKRETESSRLIISCDMV